MTELLLAELEPQIAELVLIPSSGGRFEVTVDGRLLFSKAALRRHAVPEEVLQALRTGRAVTS